MTTKLYLAVSAAVLFAACRKQTADTVAAQPPLAVAVRQYFEDSVQNQPATAEGFRARTAKTIDWHAATATRFAGHDAIVVPVAYNGSMLVTSTVGGKRRQLNLNDFTALVFYKAADAMHYVLVTSLPDSAYLANPAGHFTGLKLAEDWKGHSTGNYLYRPDGKILVCHPGTLAASVFITQYYYLEGYNYAEGAESGGEYWSEYLGSSTTYIEDGGGGGYTGSDIGSLPVPGGGGSSTTNGNSGTTTVATAPPDRIIANMNQYLFCFTNSPTAQYAVSVCVQQPVPGTRSPWTLTSNPATSIGDNPIDVGHTFLVLNETDNGTTTTRNIGFYPASFPLGQGNVPGVFNNDEDHPFNVSATFSVDASHFTQLLHYLSNNTFTYNLSTNNCTTFAITTMGVIQIYLPSTTGSWLGGLGNDPGDLGEDLRVSNAPGIQKDVLPADHANQNVCTP